MTTLEVVRRIAILYDVEEIRLELGTESLPGVQVFIDKKNKSDIEEVMARNPRKTRRALALAMMGVYTNDLYGHETIAGRNSGNVKAIKYKGSLNDRIYCQEVFTGFKKIILAVPFRKKTQFIDKRTGDVIEAVAKMNFDFQLL